MTNPSLLELLGAPSDSNYDDIDWVLIRKEKIDWDEVLDHIKSNPGEVATHGTLPLRLALENVTSQAPLKAITHLIKANPECVASNNSLALHWACENPNTSLDVIDVLAKKNLTLCWATDSLLSLPIHKATNVDHVKLLIKKFPDGLSAVDIDGRLPIHNACLYYFIPVQVLDLLITEGQKRFVGGMGGAGGLHVKDLAGKTPYDYIRGFVTADLSDRVSARIDGVTDEEVQEIYRAKFALCLAAKHKENLKYPSQNTYNYPCANKHKEDSFSTIMNKCMDISICF